MATCPASVSEASGYSVCGSAAVACQHQMKFDFRRMAPIFGAIFICRAPVSFLNFSGAEALQGGLRHLSTPCVYRLIAWHIGYQYGEAALTSREARAGGAMTEMVEATAPTVARVSDTYRWTQLAIGV